MPEALPPPEDLVELQRVRLDAEQQLADYVHATETRRREQYPDPEQVANRARWSPEESAELARQVRRHPTIVQANAERCWPQTWDALREAARAVPSG